MLKWISRVCIFLVRENILFMWIVHSILTQPSSLVTWLAGCENLLRFWILQISELKIVFSPSHNELDKRAVKISSSQLISDYRLVSPHFAGHMLLVSSALCLFLTLSIDLISIMFRWISSNLHRWHYSWCRNPIHGSATDRKINNFSLSLCSIGAMTLESSDKSSKDFDPIR